MGVPMKSPMEDITYYPSLTYSALDDSGVIYKYDSSQYAINPTGEIQVVEKIMPINVTSSSPFWKNDTVEAFRACPAYGSSEGGDVITVIGRNFKNSSQTYCRWRYCISADNQLYPRMCRNRGKLRSGEDAPVAGEVSSTTYTVLGKYVSPTRVECSVPKYVFPDPIYPDFTESADSKCIDVNGTIYFRRTFTEFLPGGLSVVREEVLTDLVILCSQDAVANKFCPDIPEIGSMMNPCYTSQFIVEVSNDGFHWSGGINARGTTIKSSILGEDDVGVSLSFTDYFIPPTFAVYTYVHYSKMYTDPGLLKMEKSFCLQPRFSEESPRLREIGYFELRSNYAAHIQVNLAHIPSTMIYGEHYRLAVFVRPSRCTEERCNSNRVRLVPPEVVPCKLPADFSYWFSDRTVPKSLLNNLTIYALDDVIFKIEVQILNGLYAPYAPYFKNTTTVRIARPERARTLVDKLDPPVRPLSPYISFEERNVPEDYFFAVAYMRSLSDTISLPLNLPPLYSAYERGRVLFMYNKSHDSLHVPTILEPYGALSKGDSYFDLPATTADDSKVLTDVYFETFHGLTKDAGIYNGDFQSLISPYLLYFSNCMTFDSYIPVWLLFEGKECALPDPESKGESWFRYYFPPLVDFDDIKYVSPFDFFAEPVADWCERWLYCNYEEDLPNVDIASRWFEASTGDVLMYLLRDPIVYSQYTGRSGPRIGPDDRGGQKAVDDIMTISSDLFIGITVDRTAADLFPGGCMLQCFPRTMILDIAYYQYDKNVKRIIYADLIYNDFDYNINQTDYKVKVKYYPLGWYYLLIYFAFDVDIFIILFLALGATQVAVAALFWVVVRATTHLQNPPELKFLSIFNLISPPPFAGTLLGTIPALSLTMLSFYLISGDRFVDNTTPVGSWYLDSYPLQYTDIGGKLDPEVQDDARNARMGLAFVVIGFVLCFAGCRIFLPKRVSKREIEIALKRDKKLASKEDVWAPTLWKRSNFMLCSIFMSFIMVMIVEFSLWGDFGTYIYQIIVMLKIVGYFIEYAFEDQLREALLMAPLSTAFAFTEGLVTLGADTLVDFVLSHFVDFIITILERTYLEPNMETIVGVLEKITHGIISLGQKMIPTYLGGKKPADEKEKKKNARPKREVEDIGANVETAETVEPILNGYSGVCSDLMVLFFTPYTIYLLIFFRIQMVLPSLYGIAEKDMTFYLYFAIIVVIFQLFSDVILISCQELFQGWKVYEYLVYSRYRFLQRETRWKGMEDTLDECLDETVRTLDQMCFSSQFYFMLAVQTSGIVYFMFGIEIMLRWQYNAFADTAAMPIIFYIIAVSIGLEIMFVFVTTKLGLWRIKHENTSWLIEQVEDDDLDLPGWEDMKGASHEAYLMNQRITSETFRLKFLNYNRPWLINQLPNLLTPRTMRRSRPYLIAQLARVISSRRGDISDDSDADDRTKKFGPVVLKPPSRNLIRWWLGKARRRLRLRTVVEPLIRRARGLECGVCLSRKQLTVEYEIDVDQMIAMYEAANPDDIEIDQVQWKAFWTRNQIYHTICLSCIQRRKEGERDGRRAVGMEGGGVLGGFEGDDEYPDWGPVFLSAASKAILINWYRKAQRVRAGKKAAAKKNRVVRDVSDDEGEEVPPEWAKQIRGMSGATKAIAVRWMRTARAQLQRRAGKGGNYGAGPSPSASVPAVEAFRGGNRSKVLRK
jgi:hypothetical protein